MKLPKIDGTMFVNVPSKWYITAHQTAPPANEDQCYRVSFTIYPNRYIRTKLQKIERLDNMPTEILALTDDIKIIRKNLHYIISEFYRLELYDKITKNYTIDQQIEFLKRYAFSTQSNIHNVCDRLFARNYAYLNNETKLKYYANLLPENNYRTATIIESLSENYQSLPELDVLFAFFLISSKSSIIRKSQNAKNYYETNQEPIAKNIQRILWNSDWGLHSVYELIKEALTNTNNPP